MCANVWSITEVVNSRRPIGRGRIVLPPQGSFQLILLFHLSYTLYSPAQTPPPPHTQIANTKSQANTNFNHIHTRQCSCRRSVSITWRRSSCWVSVSCSTKRWTCFRVATATNPTSIRRRLLLRHRARPPRHQRRTTNATWSWPVCPRRPMATRTMRPWGPSWTFTSAAVMTRNSCWWTANQLLLLPSLLDATKMSATVVCRRRLAPKCFRLVRQLSDSVADLARKSAAEVDLCNYLVGCVLCEEWEREREWERNNKRPSEINLRVW